MQVNIYGGTLAAGAYGVFSINFPDDVYRDRNLILAVAHPLENTSLATCEQYKSKDENGYYYSIGVKNVGSSATGFNIQCSGI
jgi:hypothetical protein